MKHNIKQHTTCCKAATNTRPTLNTMTQHNNNRFVPSKQDLKTGVEVNIKNLKSNWLH